MASPASARGAQAAEPSRTRVRAHGLGRPTTVLLIVAILASAAVLIDLTRDITFLLDDWEFLLFRRDLDLDALLTPHNEHLALLPILEYKAMLELFGMDSARPFQLASIATFLVSAAALFAWLRGRIDEWLALGAAILILFLGAAWEDLLWAFQIGYFGSMAAGLGMLLALRRDTPRADLIACGLLVLSLAFSSLGLPFVVGAVVAVATVPDWRRRLYVIAVPMALYATWWLGWGHQAANHISFSNAVDAPAYVFDAIASSIASLLGLTSPSVESAVSTHDWDWLLAVAAIAGAAWRIHRLGSVPRWLWVVGAIAFSFWVLSAVNEIPGRDPSSSRYQYVGGIFVLLIAAELVRGVRPALTSFSIGAAVLVLAVLSNLSFLRASARSYEATSDLIKADLGAVEIARDTVDPGFVLAEELAGTAYVSVPAGLYLSAADAFGSPADTADEIEAAPESARAAADRVLAAALRVDVSGAKPTRTPGCRVIDPAAAEVTDLPTGGAVIAASAGTEADLRMRRFADGFPIGAGTLRGGRRIAITIPEDRSTRPWQLQATGSGTVRVCPAAGS